MQNILSKVQDLIALLKKNEPITFKNIRVLDSHPIVAGGNLQSKILVLRLHPRNVDVHWAKQDSSTNEVNKHIYAPIGDAGYMFRDTAARSGFDPLKDFIYSYICPYAPLGDGEFNLSDLEDIMWFNEEVLQIFQPKIIITLGYKVFTTIDGRLDMKEFLELIKSNNPWILKDQDNFNDLTYNILPLEDPEIVASDQTGKHKQFFKNMKRLYTSKHFFIKKDSHQ